MDESKSAPDAPAAEGGLDVETLRTGARRPAETDQEPTEKRLRLRKMEAPRIVGPAIAALVLWTVYATVGMLSKDRELWAQESDFVRMQHVYHDRIEGYKKSVDAVVALCLSNGCPDTEIATVLRGDSPALDDLLSPGGGEPPEAGETAD